MDFDSKTTRDRHLQQLLCIPSHSEPVNSDEGKGDTTNEVYLLYYMIRMYAELYMIVAIVR
jgi:hypothetical protein